MDDPEESILKEAEMMSHEEIIKRFRRVLGRDMTPKERNAFFLPNQYTPPQEEKG